jgi:hypothetical protein
MATASEKVNALKSAFDAMATRVEKLTTEAPTPADFATIDDMTTRAAALAPEPAPTPAPEPTPPVEPVPPPPPPPTP